DATGRPIRCSRSSPVCDYADSTGSPCTTRTTPEPGDSTGLGIIQAVAQCINGHEWAKRQAMAAGIGFTALTDGFASAGDPAALQDICDRFGPGTVQV